MDEREISDLHPAPSADLSLRFPAVLDGMSVLVSGAQIVDVVADNLPASSILTDMIADGSVVSDKIPAEAVSTDKIADAAVTLDKVAPAVLSRASHTGDIPDSVLFADNGSSTKRARFELSGISSGQSRVITLPDRDLVLNPLWERIGAYTLSGAALLDITNLSAFDTIRLILTIDVSIASGLAIRTSVDNGATFSSGASDYQNQIGPGAAPSAAAQLSLASVALDAAAKWSIDTMLDGFNKPFSMKMMGRAYGSAGGTFTYVVNAGYRNSGSPRDAVRIFPSSGGTMTGSVYVEGIRG